MTEPIITEESDAGRLLAALAQNEQMSGAGTDLKSLIEIGAVLNLNKLQLTVALIDLKLAGMLL